MTETEGIEATHHVAERVLHPLVIWRRTFWGLIQWREVNLWLV